MSKCSVRTFPSAAIFAAALAITLPSLGNSEGVSPPRPAPHHFVINQTATQMAARLLGYVTAQNATLDFIADSRPDLAPRAIGLKQSFITKFSFPAKRAKWLLDDAYGESDTEALLEKMRVQAAEQIRSMDAVNADLMLKEMALRVTGKVSEPELQTMLWLQYATQPAEEMRYWTKSFNSAGHPKTPGIEVQLSTPLSWRQQEGNRPHVVSKWTSQYGSGDMVITLVVKEAPGVITYDEVEEIEQSNDWDWVTPEGATFLEGMAVVVDRQPALSVDSQGVRRALDVELLQSARSYIIFPEDHVVNLTCMLGGSPDGDSEVAATRFEKLKKVCRQVALSVTFPDTYR